MALHLAFGYTQGLPEQAQVAWGARLIVKQDGYVDFVPDRCDTASSGPDHSSVDFTATLDRRFPLSRLREELGRKLANGTVNTRKEREVTLYEDEMVVVVGNTNASAGYFYVVAYPADALNDAINALTDDVELGVKDCLADYPDLEPDSAAHDIGLSAALCYPRKVVERYWMKEWGSQPPESIFAD